MKTDVENSVLRLTGLTGVAVALVMTAADLLLLFIPGEGFNSPDYAWMAGVPFSRMAAGHFLGIFVLPFYLIGFCHVGLALRPAGRLLSIGAPAVMSYATVVGVFYHGSIAYPSLLVQAASAADPAVRELLIGLVRQGRVFSWPAQAAVLAGMVLGSVLLVVAILRGRTRYGRWFAALNPVVLFVVVTAVSLFLPLIGRWLLPAAQNIALALFFSLSVILTWRSGGSRAV